MADWKVSVEEVEIFEHPNADKMEIARVGMYGLVVGKGQYITGDKVIFVPKRSIIPPYFRDLLKMLKLVRHILKEVTLLNQ